MQQPTLDPDKRTWHITFGTYATRLHDDDRPTVDRRHNQPDTPFPDADPDRQRPPGDRPIRLTRPQRMHVETMVAPICELGKWHLRTASAAIEGDHVHVLLEAAPSIDPKRIRRWLKRWLGESLVKSSGCAASSSISRRSGVS